MRFKSSPRIQAIVQQIIPDQPVWDFCCDHGLIGLHAMQRNLSHEIHFVDQVESIIVRLQNRLAPFFEKQDSSYEFHTILNSLVQQNKFRLNLWTCAAQKIPQPITGTMIVAGIGGELCQQILQSLAEQMKINCQRIVLCPHKDEELFANQKTLTLGEQKFVQIKNDCVIENERQRSVIVFDRELPGLS